ncbi:MAG: hypothetical protein ABI551_00400 [Polyangiaceae bacterium]
MKASLRILALASGVILAAGAAACTVTTSNDGDAGDLFDDAGNASDTGTTPNDAGTADTGVVDNPACRDLTLDDGGVEQITFDTTGAACNTCMDNSCCALMEACFQDTTGQCQQLETCLSSCTSDPKPAECQQTCGDAFKTDAGTNPTGDLHNAWSKCEQTNCASACP